MAALSGGAQGGEGGVADAGVGALGVLSKQGHCPGGSPPVLQLGGGQTRQGEGIGGQCGVQVTNPVGRSSVDPLVGLDGQASPLLAIQAPEEAEDGRQHPGGLLVGHLIQPPLEVASHGHGGHFTQLLESRLEGKQDALARFHPGPRAERGRTQAGHGLASILGGQVRQGGLQVGQRRRHLPRVPGGVLHGGQVLPPGLATYSSSGGGRPAPGGDQGHPHPEVPRLCHGVSPAVPVQVAAAAVPLPVPDVHGFLLDVGRCGQLGHGPLLELSGHDVLVTLVP